MRYTLILAALLVGVGLGASAAPKHGAPQRHTAKRTPTTPKPTAIDRPERAVPGTPGGFRDVPPDHWAAQSVETLRRAGIVKGYPDSGK